MALGAHLHATWDILAFVPNGPGPKSKQTLRPTFWELNPVSATFVLFLKWMPILVILWTQKAKECIHMSPSKECPVQAICMHGRVGKLLSTWFRSASLFECVAWKRKMQGLVMQQNHCDRDGWKTDTQVTCACELLVILTNIIPYKETGTYQRWKAITKIQLN